MPFIWAEPRTGQGLPPELMLLAAVVKQVLHDAQSRRHDVRQEARAFLANPAHLQYWEDFLGIQTGALQRYVQQALRP